MSFRTTKMYDDSDLRLIECTKRECEYADSDACSAAVRILLTPANAAKSKVLELPDTVKWLTCASYRHASSKFRVVDPFAILVVMAPPR